MRLSPEDADELRVAFAALDRGEYVELTENELTMMAEGEWPARLVRPAPEDEASLREAVAKALRDPGRALSPEELAHWIKTGEWPKS